MTAVGNKLKKQFSLFLFNALVNQIKIAVKSRFKAIRCYYEKKLIKFLKSQKSNNFTNINTSHNEESCS